MNRRELFITGGVIVLGLLMAFPLARLFRPTVSPSRSARYGLAVHKTDDRGVDWALTPMAGRSSAAGRSDAATKPEIVVKTDIFQRGGREVLIGLILEGRDGQRYQPVVARNGARLPAPTLRIVDEGGKVILNDSFRYG